MNSQFARLFATLEKKEILAFERFLQSITVSGKVDLLEVLYLEAGIYLPHLKGDGKWRRKKKWATLSDVQRRLFRSDLLAKLEQFLGERYQSELRVFRAHIALKRDLQERGQVLRYETNDRKSDKLLSQFADGPHKSRLAYELQAERLTAKARARQLTPTDVNDLQRLHERNFMLESLRLACDGLSAKAIDPVNIQSGLLSSVVDYLRTDSSLKKDALLQVYLSCYLTLSDSGDEAAFLQLQKDLPGISGVDTKTTRELILFAINACIRRINSNLPDGERFAFQLYSMGLDNGYLLDNGRLSRFTFNNIVALALKTGDKQRAEDFVDRYAKLLPPAYAQSTEALNRARLAFEFGRMEEAMDYLQSAKDQEVLTTLNIRILQMRVYHELGENRLLDAHLDAMDIYLRRRKEQLGYRYKIYRNLVGYVRRFRRLNPFDRLAIAKFREELMVEEQLPERSWLLRVVEGV